MKIELTENEMVVIKRLQQAYHDGMYRDIYKKHGTDYPCDKYCEAFMKTTIEGLNAKIDAQTTRNRYSTPEIRIDQKAQKAAFSRSQNKR